MEGTKLNKIICGTIVTIATSIGIVQVDANTIHEAVHNRNTNILQLFLQDPNLDVNAKDNQGWTTLICSAYNNDLDAVAHLLQHPKIDVNATSVVKRTALMYAAKENNHRIVTQLLQCPNIDVNATDIFGWTALMRATYHNHIKVIRQLLQHPAIDVTIRNKEMQTALELVKTEESKSMIEDHIFNTNVQRKSARK